MKIKFKASDYYGRQVECYEVIKETKSAITYKDHMGKEKKQQKHASRFAWFNTFEEARDWMLMMQEERVERAEGTLRSMAMRAEEIKNMKPPEEPND